MADVKSMTGNFATDQAHLVKEARVTPEQARQLIAAYGNDRVKLMRAAKSFANKNPTVRSPRV